MRAAAPDVDAVGFGIPALVECATRASRAGRPTCRSRACRFRDLMSERLGLPVVVDNDANAALLAEHARGAARGAPTRCCSRSAPASAAGCCSTGGSTAARAAWRPSSGTWSSTSTAPTARATARAAAAWRCSRRAPRSGASGGAAAAARRSRRSAGGVAAGREITGALVTELAHEGDAAAVPVLAEIGRRLGAGLASS